MNNRWIAIGDLVRFHDTASKKRTIGVVTEQRLDNCNIQGVVPTFSVLWASGLISEHSSWQLHKVEPNENR